MAGELRRANSDHQAAFSAYESRLRPFIENKQKSAAQFTSSFAAKTEAGIFFRKFVTKAMKINWVAELAIGRRLRDNLALPDYED